MNEVLNGLVHTDVPLGIIPAGTANVLGVELRMRGGALAVARDLGSYVPSRVSVGKLSNSLNPDGRYFLLMAGAGLDARIVYEINARLKARLGKGAYWVAGFGQLGRRFPALQVRVRDWTVTCSFALASRVRNYGGDLYIARGASLFAHEFEVVLFEGQQSWVYLRYFLGVLTGRLGRMKGITVTRAQRMDLECATDPRIYIQIDGEYAGRLPGRVEIAEKAVTLLTPPTFAHMHG
jgi:diacylglycerol kinase family enzyme